MIRLAALSDTERWLDADSHSSNIQQHYSPEFANRFTPDQFTALLTLTTLINPLDVDDEDDEIPELITVNELNRLCDHELEAALNGVLTGDCDLALSWIHGQGWQLGDTDCQSN